MSYLLNDLRNFNKFFRKDGFTLSLEDSFLEKSQGEGSVDSPPHPSLLKVNCVYGACNLTKQHFGIPTCFWFQLVSLSNLFLKFGKFLLLYLGYGCMTFNFTTQITLGNIDKKILSCLVDFGC